MAMRLERPSASGSLLQNRDDAGKSATKRGLGRPDSEMEGQGGQDVTILLGRSSIRYEYVQSFAKQQAFGCVICP